MTPIQKETEPTDVSSRQRLWMLYVPAGVALLFVLLLVLVLAIPGSFLRLNKWELSIITDTITILVVLCPLVICMSPLYLGLMAGIYLTGKAHGGTQRLMKRAQNVSASTADKTAQVAESLGKQSVSINSRFAFIERFFNVFNRSESKNENE